MIAGVQSCNSKVCSVNNKSTNVGTLEMMHKIIPFLPLFQSATL